MQNSPSKVTVWTGTNQVEIERAERTYMNALGPGDYDLPSLTGRFSIESKMRNIPALSFGMRPYKVGWHPELKADFVGQSSPPVTTYSPKKESRVTLGRISLEKKFREPTSVTNLRETLPVQYSSIYDKNTIFNGNPTGREEYSRSVVLDRKRNKQDQSEIAHQTMSDALNAAIPSVSTMRTYKQVSMGFSKRSDFTKVAQQSHDPGFYDIHN